MGQFRWWVRNGNGNNNLDGPRRSRPGGRHPDDYGDGDGHRRKDRDGFAGDHFRPSSAAATAATAAWTADGDDYVPDFGDDVPDPDISDDDARRDVRRRVRLNDLVGDLE